MQLNRLFEMVYLLLERGSVTAAEFAERFEISTRTVYRDIDTLSGAGIPVYASRGKGGGISLMRQFVLDKSLLSEEDQNEILFALQSLKAAGASPDDKVFSRLSGLFQKQREELVHWIDVDFSQWGSPLSEKHAFDTIKSGILQKRVVVFTYYSSYGERTERQVEPMKLTIRVGGGYLQGYCRTRQAFRTFRLSRMEGVRLTEEQFLRREGLPPLEGPLTFPEEIIDLVLWFPPDMGYQVLDHFSRDQIEQNPDGSYTVQTAFQSGEWLAGYLLSFGENVKVLEPASVQEMIRERAERISRLYAGSNG